MDPTILDLLFFEFPDFLFQIVDHILLMSHIVNRITLQLMYLMFKEIVFQHNNIAFLYIFD
jgi:hypothetical protein